MKRSILLAIIFISLIGCKLLFPSTTRPESEIQDTLDLYVQAINENRPELLDQVVAPDNKPFKRLVRSRFDEYQESWTAGSQLPSLKVYSIREKPHGYYQARFNSIDGSAGTWTFKNVGDRWLLAEPTVEEIGVPEEVITQYFTFITYPWADDINSEVIDLMENAREEVFQKLGKAPEKRAKVEIRPIYGLERFSPMDWNAYYQPASGNDLDRIVIYSPYSFAFGLYDQYSGWQEYLSDTLVHEFTHMTHNLSFDDAGARLATWMSEGLAEYVADASYDQDAACHAAHAGVLIPLVDRESQANKQDLAHMESLSINHELAYDYAYTVVAFIAEKHGGLDGFWKLAQTFDRVQDMDEALQETFGVGLDQFEREWMEWVKAGC
jgi:Peptidase MA superfamily